MSFGGHAVPVRVLATLTTAPSHEGLNKVSLVIVTFEEHVGLVGALAFAVAERGPSCSILRTPVT